MKLREMLIRVNMEDLREQTHSRHYELYRRCKLEEMGFKDTDPDSKPFRYLSHQFSPAQPSQPRVCGSFTLEHPQGISTQVLRPRAAELSHLPILPASPSLPSRRSCGQVGLVSTGPGRRPIGPARPMISLLQVCTHGSCSQLYRRGP